MPWTWQSSQVEPWEADFVCDGLPDDVDPTIIDDAVEAASGVLWALSGRKYGYRTTKIRPALQRCLADYGWLAFERYGWNAYSLPSFGVELMGGWMPMLCGDCFSLECACRDLKIFRLANEAMPNPPALPNPVVEVRIDGAVFTNWTLVQNWYLKRTDGKNWPTCQNLSRPDTEDDTFSVTYRWGSPPPPLGKQAVGALACELVKSRLDLSCELPQRIQTVSRQGVSFTLLDPMEFLEKGRTGIYVVDLFLVTYNPTGSRRPSGVFRADRW